MKVYTLNSFAQDDETGRFTEYYGNHGVFIMKHYAESEGVTDENPHATLEAGERTCSLGGVLVAGVHADDRQVRSRRSDVLSDSQPTHRSD